MSAIGMDGCRFALSQAKRLQASSFDCSAVELRCELGLRLPAALAGKAFARLTGKNSSV
jgi:hypothetical protein